MSFVPIGGKKVRKGGPGASLFFTDFYFIIFSFEGVQTIGVLTVLNAFLCFYTVVTCLTNKHSNWEINTCIGYVVVIKPEAIIGQLLSLR